MHTQVAIIGAGPAGLLLGRILQSHGIGTVILERRSRDYVLARVRAGMLEQGTVDTLREYGVAERLDEMGVAHPTMQFLWNGVRRDVPLEDEDGRRLTNYGQSYVVEDLIKHREADGLPIVFEAEVSSLDGIEDSPSVTYSVDGETKTLTCDFIAGCDGYLGVSRRSLPGAEAASYLKEFPFAWFGILAEATPNPHTRGFSNTPRGLAVSSARSATRSRLYLQVDPEFDITSMSDDEIWDELDRRLSDQDGNKVTRGPIIEKSVARLRAFVCEKMRHGKLAIAGDAAHIVPPSGAKGLNLAVGDVRLLGEAIRRHLLDKDDALLDDYSRLALERIWPTVHWSCLMSEAFHTFPGQTEFDTRRQHQTLDFWAHDEIGNRWFREAMLGLPYAV
ncbi:4-hydroxybenzoate 3-monooxygenase [Sinisalibacter aestuarii]|uniref:4-hydroxybenzoate 3-monooxygenase n=1 Tax=Sinisalibacter aestuarii TaxID=2949426 RepID=A0ABQ5M015_9RHOB|nr:4-hydroxybenzoate 3-monooxygenase [Sinisalibacter aestuarii]GKY89936.1 4-hydroxybenzoate 3-monooxygenase [Sinisalibacter aestuarii]